MNKTEQKWLEHINAWRSSGLSQADYCKKEGINPRSFAARKSQLSKTVYKGNFVPLTPNSEFSVTLNSAVKLSFGSEPSPAWLAQLLQQMEHDHVGRQQV